jgi:heme/copper-type cytochrome/quinol oxidase subunit 4
VSFRFVTKSIHAYFIDYPVAILLTVAPFLLKLGDTNPIAFWLSIVVGIAAFLLAAVTDHPTGIVRVVPYWLHLWVDRAVGVVFIIAPLVFNFTKLDAWYYWVLAAAVLLTTSVFNAPEATTPTGASLDKRRPA